MTINRAEHEARRIWDLWVAMLAPTMPGKTRKERREQAQAFLKSTLRRAFGVKDGAA